MKPRISQILALILVIVCISYASAETLRISTPERCFKGSARAKCTGGNWTISFNKDDSGNGYLIKVEPWDARDYWQPSTRYILYHIRNGQNVKLSEITESQDTHATGLSLNCDESTANITITCPGGKQLFSDILRDIKFLPNTTIEVSTDKRTKLLALDNDFTPYPAPRIISIPDTLDSQNGLLGTWIYLDRNMPEYSVQLGGKYSLIIIPDEDCQDGLIAAYADGAKINSTLWQSGQIKALFKPTVFENHYDVIWYDSHNEAVEDECSATFDENNILTISFPLHKTTIRFSRPYTSE